METTLFGLAFVTTIMYYVRLEVNYNRKVAREKFKVEQNSHDQPGVPSYYDFVIVGGGTAGCLLAGKLSKKFQVLLLEAGGPPPSAYDMPILRKFGEVENDTDLSWIYYTTEQKFVSNRKIKYLAARMLGGSHSHNGLVFTRGNPRSYDQWVKLTSDPSWKYENVLKLYKDLEQYKGIFPSDQRGSRGPLQVHTANPPYLEYYKAAAAELGYAYGDMNGPQKEGLSPLDVTTRGGMTETTFTVFVQPIMELRESLTVLTYSEVTEILFKGKTAIGVKYSRFGKEFQVKANREVIISAGTLGSPMLLFKSGIGPSQMLQKAGIPVRVNLPVGKTLEDHAAVRLNFTVKNLTAFPTLESNITKEVLESYLKGKTDGYLSELAYGPALFMVSSVAKAAGEFGWPDIELADEVGEVSPDSRPIHRTAIVVNRPSSVGSLKLNTTAYKLGERHNTKLALLDFNYLGSKKDVQKLKDGIDIALKLYNQDVFKSVGLTIIPNAECAQKSAVNSTHYWKCVIETSLYSYIHATGTCRIGKDSNDPMGVLDKTFRVMGTRGLRVIDSSVMPKVMNSNINAPTVLIAEKGFRAIDSHFLMKIKQTGEESIAKHMIIPSY